MYMYILYSVTWKIFNDIVPVDLESILSDGGRNPFLTSAIDLLLRERDSAKHLTLHSSQSWTGLNQMNPGNGLLEVLESRRRLHSAKGQWDQRRIAYGQRTLAGLVWHTSSL